MVLPTSPYPVAMPRLVRFTTVGREIALAHGEGNEGCTLRTTEEVLRILDFLAQAVADGGSGAYRVCAKTLARQTGLTMAWDNLCRVRGLRVL